MGKIKNFIKAFKKIKTSEEAILMGLKFYKNLHGDAINHYDCRSLWTDEYNIIYNCEEYYDNRNEIKLRKIKIQKILKTKNLWNIPN